MGAPTAQTFTYFDSQLQGNLLPRLNTLRKGSQFCDVQLQVGHHTLPAHRAVLASASPFLHELFCDEERNFPYFYKLREIDWESFEALVNYAYTSKLEIPPDKICDVFKTAIKLKMVDAARACSRHMADHLTDTNCLSVREFAMECLDVALVSSADKYIQEHIAEVVQNRHAQNLNFLEVDILVNDHHEMREAEDPVICQLVVDWASQKIETGQTIEELTKTDLVHMMFLNGDNILRECDEIDERSEMSNDVITDYKKVKKRNSTMSKNRLSKPHRKPSGDQIPNGHNGQNGYQNGHTDIHDNNIIGIQRVSDNACMCIASLDYTIIKLSINFRYQPSAPPSEGGESPIHTPSPRSSPRSSLCVEKHFSYSPLACMHQARCSVGTGVLDGKLIIMGGYDRGECLDSVESFDLSSNTWVAMCAMRDPRGRFDVAQLDGKLYACGGCNGTNELKSVECYDPKEKKWSRVPDMLNAKSSHGVAGLNGRLYLMGGSKGSSGTNSCEMYQPENQQWTAIAPLNHKRSQAGVCCMNGQIVVVGGSISWSCMNSVELYDPDENKWTNLAPLNVSRRGAGITMFKGKLYVIGGNDGTSSLASTEIYDPETDTWTFGPNLTTSRANVGVAVVNGRLFAVGGFSSNTFLNSVEYLEEKSTEFSSYLPLDFLS